jgi:hypothetical protein
MPNPNPVVEALKRIIEYFNSNPCCVLDINDLASHRPDCARGIAITVLPEAERLSRLDERMKATLAHFDNAFHCEMLTLLEMVERDHHYKMETRRLEAELSELRKHEAAGTPVAIVDALFDFAERECGHNSASSRHALTTVEKWVKDAKAELSELRKEHDEAWKEAKEAGATVGILPVETTSLSGLICGTADKVDELLGDHKDRERMDWMCVHCIGRDANRIWLLAFEISPQKSLREAIDEAIDAAMESKP